MRTCILTILLGLAAAQALHAATYYTAKTGSDSNPGSSSAPFLTVRKGIAALRAGDTLFIRAGTYAEAISDGIASGTSWGAPTTLAAYSGERVVIAPASGARVFQLREAHYIVLDGFVMDARNVSANVVKIMAPGSHIRIKNSELMNAPSQGVLVAVGTGSNEFINLKVHDNGGSRGDLDHGLYIESANNLVERCDIYRNAGKGVQVYSEGGSQTSNNIVRYNKIHDNARIGPRGVGLILASGSNNKAHDNLIWNNAGGVQIDYGAVGAKVYNNTIYKNSGSAVSLGGGSGASGAVVRNNIIFQNSSGITGSQSGSVISNNLTTDPLFAGAAGLDLRLRAGSPAIDTGVNLAGEGVGADFAGTPRPVGCCYDIGAYEYAGAPAGGDTTPPVISGVAASSVSGTGATVGWTTSEPADGQVEYGPSSSYGSSTALNATLSSGHAAPLAGLAPGTVYHFRVKSRDAAGNLATSPDATFTTASSAPPPSADCTVSAPSWRNVALPAQTGAFTVEFDATPSASAMDGVIGLSDGPASGYSALAAAVRFNSAGMIDARSGGAYAAAAAVRYAANVAYRFRLVVNLAARTYTAYVRPAGGAEQRLGADYAFRSEQKSVARLDNIGLYASRGSESVCSARVTASGPAADLTPPVISAVSASGLTASGATIGWTTSEPADGVVEYGATSAYGSATAVNPTLSTSHSAALSGLSAGALYHYRVKSRDAAGNQAASGDATFTTAAAAPPAGNCQTSAGAWRSFALPAMTGTFTAEFDATPGASGMDGVIGLSNGPASGYTALAAGVRFSTGGRIEARSGGAYSAATAIPYSANLPYHFRLVVDLTTRTYSAFVRQGSNPEQLIGAGYAFRGEQSTVTMLNSLGFYSAGQSETVCDPTAR